MSQADLMGLGVPAEVAKRIGMTPTAITCAGTSSQANATAVASQVKCLILSAASSSANGAVLSSSVGQGEFITASNAGSTTALVYCPSGFTMNGTSNGSVSIAQNKAAIIWRTSATAFVSVLTA